MNTISQSISQSISHSIDQSIFSGIWDYIQSTRDEVIDLESRVQKAKNNVEEVQKLMSTWSKSPLFTRKEEKNDCLLNLTDREDRLKKRYDEINAIGEKIHGLLKVCCLLSVLPFCC